MKQIIAFIIMGYFSVLQMLTAQNIQEKGCGFDEGQDYLKNNTEFQENQRNFEQFFVLNYVSHSYLNDLRFYLLKALNEHLFSAC